MYAESGWSFHLKVWFYSGLRNWQNATFFTGSSQRLSRDPYVAAHNVRLQTDKIPDKQWDCCVWKSSYLAGGKRVPKGMWNQQPPINRTPPRFWTLYSRTKAENPTRGCPPKWWVDAGLEWVGGDSKFLFKMTPKSARRTPRKDAPQHSPWFCSTRALLKQCQTRTRVSKVALHWPLNFWGKKVRLKQNYTRTA